MNFTNISQWLSKTPKGHLEWRRSCDYDALFRPSGRPANLLEQTILYNSLLLVNQWTKAFQQQSDWFFESIFWGSSVEIEGINLSHERNSTDGKKGWCVLHNRARWNMPQRLKSSKIIIGHTFSYVKLNFKVGLFSWTFWFEAVFRCKFGILVLVTFTF